jgi:hypothetical protein
MIPRLALTIVLVSSVAVANPLTVTFAGTASGSIGSEQLTNASFTITLTSDTSLLATSGNDTFTPSGTSATISLSGGVNATFTDDQAVFLNQSEDNLGIWHGGSPDFLTIGNLAFASYNFTTSLPATSGTTNFLPNTFSTSAGVLALSSMNAVTVTVTIGSVAGSALHFVPIAPCRVVDTRNADGPFGGPILSPGTTRSFTIPSGSCGIPTTAQAYSFNVSVVPSGALGYLTVWPAGQSQPVVATLNSLDGRIKSNAAIIPAGTNGGVNVYSTNETQVILDINGYFVPAATSGTLEFYPMTPCRLVDTRIDLLTTGALTAGSTRTLPLRSSSCNIPASAQVYSLNVTVVPPNGGVVAYLTVFPAGSSVPVASTLNDLTGTDVGNAAIVQAGTDGSIEAYSTDDTDLVVDINGYFAPAGAGGLSLYPLSPCRVLDTRQPPISSAFVGELDVNVSASGCAPSASAQAYVFNATVIPSGALGYLTLWPQGTSQPTVATLNALDGAITNNMAIVGTSNGEISSYVTNETNLVLDLFGYFAP